MRCSGQVFFLFVLSPTTASLACRIPAYLCRIQCASNPCAWLRRRWTPQAELGPYGRIRHSPSSPWMVQVASGIGGGKCYCNFSTNGTCTLGVLARVQCPPGWIPFCTSRTSLAAASCGCLLQCPFCVALTQMRDLCV